MNDLRMYVEHLFEGRVLTPEMIEFKEEIYGNLMARYEDYVAGGMAESEALEQTKASMTDIDELLAAGAAAPMQAHEDTLATAKGATDSGVQAGAEQAPSLSEQQGAAVPVDASPTARPARKKWPFVVGGIAAAFVILAIIGGLAFAFFVRQSGAGSQGTSGGATITNGAANQNQNGAATGNAGNGSNGAAQDNGNAATPSYRDPEDQAEYEATLALDNAITQNGVDALQQAVAAGGEAGQLVSYLPMSEYLASASADGSASAIEVGYEGVSDLIDGDAIERAVLYNAVALFSACPGFERVSISVQEQYESAYDAERYDFARATLEHAFGAASNGAISQLNSSLFESTDAWDQVRDYVYRENFRERQIDFAEQDD